MTCGFFEKQPGVYRHRPNLELAAVFAAFGLPSSSVILDR
jgi:hypothetical protein